MHFGRLRLSGLLVLLLLSSAACTSADAIARPVPGGAALPSYDPPAEAPDFCAALADGTDLPRVPAAMGALAVSPDDVEARLYLGSAADEVRGVLEDLRDAGGHADVETALDALATALETANDETVTGVVRADVVRTLDAVGDRVQPLCRFPR